jgi:hypothetical protein
MSFVVRSSLVGLAACLLCAAPATARADEPPAAPDSAAAEASLAPARARALAHDYYDEEMKSALLFVGYGVVTGGAGSLGLTQSGDFAHGLGWSSLILGGVTALGGVGYGVAVKVRGDHYKGLAETDSAAFAKEEGEHIGGTDRRFALYLGAEIGEALAGIGMATYGLAAKNELWKGIGIGAAIQGIGLFVIDVPGAGRAARYRDDVRRLAPSLGVSVGGGARPWAATLSQSF